jgi:hypothetical protein
MEDRERLRELYDRTVKPRLSVHELDRKRLLRASAKALAASVLLLAAVFYVPFFLVVFAILAALGIVPRTSLRAWFPSLEGFRRRFKGDVVEQVFRIVHPEGTYDATAGMGQYWFEESGLFTKRIDRYESDDGFRGQILGTTFEAAEVRATYARGSGDSRRTLEVLGGLFLRLDFNKNLKAATIVQPEDAPGWRLGDRSGLEPIKLEDPEFERRFAVFASDPVEARYVLTPLLMERILNLRSRLERPLYLSFRGNHVHLAVHHGRRLFEPSLFKPVSFETVEEIAELFEFAERVVRELELNVRIWSKGPAPMAVH